MADKQIKLIFESDITQYASFYPVCDKSKAGIATISQNAGTSAFYIGGAGVNGAFGKQLTDYGIYKEVEYKFNHILDHLEEEPCNVIVGFQEWQDKAKLVEGMLYTVGPNLCTKTVFEETDKELIANIYKDAIKQIIKHNQDNPTYQFQCLRISVISSEIYGISRGGEAYLYELLTVILTAIINQMIESWDNVFTHISFQSKYETMIEKIINKATGMTDR